MPQHAAPAPARQHAAPQPGSNHEPRLQRTCACGRHTVDGGECGECAKKRVALQRWASDSPSPASLLRSRQPAARGEPAEGTRRGRDFLRLGVQGADGARRTAGSLGWLAGALGTAVAGAGHVEARRARGSTAWRTESVRGAEPPAGQEPQGAAEAANDRSADGPASPIPGAASSESSAAAAASPGTASPAGAAHGPAPAAPVAAAPSPAPRAGRSHSLDENRDERREGEEPQHEEEGIQTLPPRRLLVDDGGEEPRPGQMRSAEFLARLRTEVTRAAEEALAGTGQTTDGCPYLRVWFAYYGERGSRNVERALRRYAPEVARARTAADCVPLVVARVRRAVATWARTGEITGVPIGLPADGALPAGLTPPMWTTGSSRPFAIQLKERGGGGRKADDPAAVQAELGDGRPLDPAVRSRMESAFGRGFTSVRMHTGATAARLAAEQNARAFTVGSHVAFGAGEYRPGTLAGDALIAHELAHVVQQQGTATANGARQATAGSGYARLEADADAAAAGVVGRLFGGATQLAGAAGPALRSGLRLQRCGSTPATVIAASPVVIPNEWKKQLPDNVPKSSGPEHMRWGGYMECIAWTTDGAKGYIVQEIANKIAPTKCPNITGATEVVSPTPHFWEAWSVDQFGGVSPDVEGAHDLFYRRAQAGKSGNWSIDANVYWVKELDKQANFRIGGARDAAGLLSTTTAPAGLGKVLLKRHAGGKWECNGDHKRA